VLRTKDYILWGKEDDDEEGGEEEGERKRTGKKTL
jgi:hypothetical protein